jgi:hypothetical protein
MKGRESPTVVTVNENGESTVADAFSGLSIASRLASDTSTAPISHPPP